MCIIRKALCPYVLDARLGLWVSLEHACTCAPTTNQLFFSTAWEENSVRIILKCLLNSQFYSTIQNNFKVNNTVKNQLIQNLQILTENM